MNRQPDRRLRDFGIIDNILCPESAHDYSRHEPMGAIAGQMDRFGGEIAEIGSLDRHFTSCPRSVVSDQCSTFGSGAGVYGKLGA